MDFKKMSQEELEQLSYTDLTYYLLQTKPLATNELFTKIMKILALPETAYATKIGDYYTSLTTDKRFIILPNGKWDLRTNHSSKNFVVIEEEEEEELEIDTNEEEPVVEETFDLTSENEEDDLVGDEEIIENLEVIEEDYDV